MKHSYIRLVACTIGVLLSVRLLAPGLAEAQTGWTVVTSPNQGSGNNELHGVASVSGNDVWAVGEADNSLGNNEPLTMHWDGTAWSIVPSPTTGIIVGNFFGVAAAATNDVWAVGSYLPTKGSGQALIEHWNGRAWSVAKKAPSVAGSSLDAATVVSANDVWAVGNVSNASGVEQTFIEHWNGKQWSVVASPSPGAQTNFLQGVTAVATNDVWAVGSFRNASGASQTIALHWNGTAWSIVPSPSPSASAGGVGDEFLGTAAVSTSDVWAVGDSGSGTLIEQWNGTSWNVVPSPSPSTLANLLFGVAVVSSTDIWAVGETQDPTSGIPSTLIEQWNGTGWIVVPSPNPGAGTTPGDSLRGASADPITGQAWAVGLFTPAFGSGEQTLTEFNP
jgi:hypothetical protein